MSEQISNHTKKTNTGGTTRRSTKMENQSRMNQAQEDELIKMPINSATETGRTFYEYTLDGKKIAFHKDAQVVVQVGRGKSAYKTKYSFEAKEFALAMFYYNGTNIGRGYKKRLVCFNLNKPLLARAFS